MAFAFFPDSIDLVEQVRRALVAASLFCRHVAAPAEADLGGEGQVVPEVVEQHLVEGEQHDAGGHGLVLHDEAQLAEPRGRELARSWLERPYRQRGEGQGDQDEPEGPEQRARELGGLHFGGRVRTF